ncbi:hypothetical protein IQ266_06010 [filamentous cyanobacterium LEGE 11480]|uniref:Uncharacterized protein n=1 Tax=Romeriopsis navalis LEGE 11480 TaxID=2777977 RepID=A0A928VIP2_9CYAN|nr:hypothetical protein [Romeriopsis navalis]MBE9029316.1 hypothetical protein [Romeriopsis navalis LEGE 11480]
MLHRFNRFTIAALILLPLWGCGGMNVTNMPTQSTTVNRTIDAPADAMQNGRYPVDKASYDDATGTYTLSLLDVPAAMPATVTLPRLKMVRLTDFQIKNGKQSYVKLLNGRATLYLRDDFRIAYTHNVTQVQTNPDTGIQETVIMRQEVISWAPFYGVISGTRTGNMAFIPQYYVPPVYQPGLVMLHGYGGYGRTYNMAVTNYRTRYSQPPVVERNRTRFRRTGQLKNGRLRRSKIRVLSNKTGERRTDHQRSKTSLSRQKRSTGSGFGSNTLKRDKENSMKRTSNRRKRSFGSMRTKTHRSGGFGRSGRR